MTKLSTTNVTCPGCSLVHSVVLHDSANVTLAPTLKQQVLDGSLFMMRCPRCGRVDNVTYPCLYHDMQRQLLVNLVPGGATAPAAPPQFSGYVLRQVDRVHDLQEKVRIFEAGLNDAVVELYKMFLTTKAAEIVRGGTMRFHSLLPSGNFVFAILRENEPVEFKELPRGFYESNLTGDYASLAAKAQVRGQWLKVDVELVMNHMLEMARGPGTPA